MQTKRVVVFVVVATTRVAAFAAAAAAAAANAFVDSSYCCWTWNAANWYCYSMESAAAAIVAAAVAIVVAAVEAFVPCVARGPIDLDAD